MPIGNKHTQPSSQNYLISRKVLKMRLKDIMERKCLVFKTSQQYELLEKERMAK